MRFHPVFDFRAGELAALRDLTPDQAVAVAAVARDGVLSRGQLLALGLDTAGITRRVRRGTLFRRHAGVYAVGRADLTYRGEARAAVLRCGRRAVLSHRTAAWLQELLSQRGRVSVTTTTRLAPPAGIDLRLTVRWEPGEVVWVDGLPCTSVARTLADLAGTSAKDFDRAWDVADGRLLLDAGPLTAQVSRQREGAALLRARLGHREQAPPGESVLEERFRSLCRDFHLGVPVAQWPLQTGDRSGRVDFVFEPERLAVEVDGRRWHAIQQAHDRDRERDLALRELGYDPHRYVYRQVCDAAPRVAAVLRSALGARRRGTEGGT